MFRVGGGALGERGLCIRPPGNVTGNECLCVKASTSHEPRPRGKRPVSAGPPRRGCRRSPHSLRAATGTWVLYLHSENVRSYMCMNSQSIKRTSRKHEWGLPWRRDFVYRRVRETWHAGMTLPAFRSLAARDDDAHALTALQPGQSPNPLDKKVILEAHCKKRYWSWPRSPCLFATYLTLCHLFLI